MRLLYVYNRLNTGFPQSILRDFIHVFLSKNFTKICQISSNSLAFKYINYNFNLEPLLKCSKQNPDIIKDRAIEYASAFYYFYIILILYKILKHKIERNKYEEFCYYSHEWLSYGILSGFNAYSELELPFSYSAIAEELSYLTSKDKESLVITVNQDKQSFEFKIKNNMIFQERYEKEGYENIFYNEDFIKDRNIKNIFRVARGSNSNSIKFVYKRASGQRTIGRIFGFSENEKIYVSKLYNEGLYCINNMILFCFFAIFENCNCRGFQPSCQNEINKFVNSFKGRNKRYVAEKISIIVLLAFYPDLKEEIIKKYFKHKIQREEILKETKKLELMLKSSNKSYLRETLKLLRKSYVW